jgi:hypothetical protein
MAEINAQKGMRLMYKKTKRDEIKPKALKK